MMTEPERVDLAVYLPVLLGRMEKTPESKRENQCLNLATGSYLYAQQFLDGIFNSVIFPTIYGSWPILKVLNLKQEFKQKIKFHSSS